MELIVACLPSIQKTLYLCPKTAQTGSREDACHPNTGRKKQEDQKLKVITGYINDAKSNMRQYVKNKEISVTISN